MRLGGRTAFITDGAIGFGRAFACAWWVRAHALEVALTVQAELDSRAAEADALRRGHVERARHRTDLALAVDPDNRLVADSLEADWNDALRALQAAREDYERASAAATATLTDQVKHQIGSLATDFPALWSNPHPRSGP